MKSFNLSKVSTAAAIVMATVCSTGQAIQLTPESAAANNPSAGGRWLTKSEAVAILSTPTVALGTYYQPPNVSFKDGREVCGANTTPIGRLDGCTSRWYTTQNTPTGTGGSKWPNGIMTIGRNSPNGDYVMTNATITGTKYFAKSPPVTSSTEPGYAGCVSTDETLSKSSAVAVAISTSITNSTNIEEVFGTSSKESHSFEYEIATTGTAGFNILNLARAEAAVTQKVGTKNTWEAGSTHDRKQGKSTAVAFSDGTTQTNTSVVNQKIPAGMVGQSGYWFPYTEIYGIFSFGRLTPPGLNNTKYEKVNLSNGTFYKLSTASGQFHTDANLSNVWIGKIVLATSSLNVPGTINATNVQGLLQKPMTPMLYREACAADVATRNYAPAIKASLCTYNKTVAAVFPDACK